MKCPACKCRISEVVDCRESASNIQREHRCESCRGTWHTSERVITEVKGSRPPVQHWRGRR